MTRPMVFDDAVVDRGRSRPIGELWAEFLRGLIGLFRAETPGGGGLETPPDDEPPADGQPRQKPVLAIRGPRSLVGAYVGDYSPTYLTQPEPQPTHPPDQPDPPPTGYKLADKGLDPEKSPEAGRTDPWSSRLREVLLAIFAGDWPPGSGRDKN